ncbi:MAG TPA: hypothetical protein VK871_03450, partial [Candidatus Limnocylindrales bacterium]|nr:hypothetical protein [Candidatus Limnocylindrales bacterium]
SRAAIVLVGDADAFGDALDTAGFGPVTIERETGPLEAAREAEPKAAVGPVDAGPEGPTEGADEPSAGDDTTEPHPSGVADGD